MTVNACVAETRDEAEQLIRPNLQMMAWLRTGEPLRALDLVEDSERNQLTATQQAIVASGMERAVVGAPVEAADQIRQLASHFGVDEVMVSPVAAARRGCDPATAPARETTLRLLAEQLL